MEEDVRWIQRFNNFKRAVTLLCEILDSTDDICSLACHDERPKSYEPYL